MKKNYFFLSLLLVQAFIGKAQWVLENSAFTTPGIGVHSICALDVNNVWASGLDTVSTASHTTINMVTKTINGGALWTQETVTGATGFDINNVTAISKDTAWVSMGNPTLGGGRIYRTNDGGATWTQQNNAGFTGANGYADDIYFFDKNNGVCVGDSNSGNWEIYTTANGGGAWARVAIGSIPPNTVQETGNNGIFTVVGNTIWFGTSAGRIYKSINQGLAWTVVSTTLTNIAALAFKDANNGIAEDGGNIIKTTDGGATWTAVVTTGTVFDGYLCYVPGTTAGYVCAGNGTNNKGSAYSNDGGTTWGQIDAIDHGAVAFVSQTTGWCGGFNTSATVGGMYKWSNALGIAPLELNAETLSLFPNPMHAAASVIISPEPASSWNFSLYDLTGQKVFETLVSGGQYSLERNNLPKGIYFFRAFLNGKFLNSGKVVME